LRISGVAEAVKGAPMRRSMLASRPIARSSFSLKSDASADSATPAPFQGNPKERLTRSDF